MGAAKPDSTGSPEPPDGPTPEEGAVGAGAGAGASDSDAGHSDAAVAATSDGGTPAPAHAGRIDRRTFIGLAAAGGLAAATFGIVRLTGDPARPAARADGGVKKEHPASGSREGTTSTTGAASAAGVPLPRSAAIVAENARTGTAWWVTTPQQAGDIEGYADRVSAQRGDTVQLFVSTKAPTFHVEAYRMGYYQGIGARLVWSSDQLPGMVQAPPTLLAATNTIECGWSPSLAVTIDDRWPPGAYLLKLVGPTNEQQFVPLCVRDDTSTAAVVIQHSVTTWQAYNRWGGYSLYYGNRGGALSYTHAPAGGTFADRARMVSFDRPYDHDWASGAADFVGNELPVIYQAERLGLDVTYWTDLDLHAAPQLLTNHRALISLGHDEYWSQPMRDGAAAALSAGTNLAFLGANACYRQIRMQPSLLGVDRVQVCYKSAEEDPLAKTDPTLTTVNWPQSPVLRPEAELIGSTYQDIDAAADMVVGDSTSWLFAGTGLTDGQHLPQLIIGEFDRYVPSGGGPTNVDVLAHSVIANRGGNYSDVTWYTVPGGGGVFATGNANWVNGLADSSLIPPNVLPDPTPGITAPLLTAMENLYAVIANGPAGLTQPSSGTWEKFYGSSSAGPTPVVNNTA